ncbi:MAG: glycosyltransferase family 4 protein [Candidatus Woesearchaeota archaeon]
MFGWEFPPFSSGGLGTACQGLTKGLAEQGAYITFVIPKANPSINSADVSINPNINLVSADNFLPSKVKIKVVNSLLMPYITSQGYNERMLLVAKSRHDKSFTTELYGWNLFEEVYRYAEKAKWIALSDDFDIIHSHDWMTYPAAIKAKQITNKPLIVHVHATEFDRTGDHPNEIVYKIERMGMHEADKVIAVSNYTKWKIVENYGIPPEKIEVVHNAVNFPDYWCFGNERMDDCKTVLFLGRITLQKGPEYFLYAAKRVLEKEPNVRFIMAGSGDMEPWIIEKAAELGISHRVLFTGFLRGADVDRAYRMADLYVMPSVSEPFGITPLEAMRNGTPVIISKTSGVSEVVSHCLKVDFWDIDQLSNKILSVIKYNSLHSELCSNGQEEIKKFNWKEPARKCINIYNQVIYNQVVKHSMRL